MGSLLPGSSASPKTFSCLICLDHKVLGAGVVAQHTRLIMQIEMCFPARIDGEMARVHARSEEICHRSEWVWSSRLRVL